MSDPIDPFDPVGEALKALHQSNLLAAKDARIKQLKAEVERLTAFTTRTIITNEELQTENARLKVEVKHLSKNDKKWYEFCVKIMDKVERLTKAGDAIAEIFANERACDNDCSVSDLYEFHSLLKEWNAAKEGKQP